MTNVAASVSAVVRLHPSDNVVVATHRIELGTTIASERIQAIQMIPLGHKMAVATIAAGEPILKYGQVIGAATVDIAPGEHVHIHNLAVSNLRRAAEIVAAPDRQVTPRTFQGYRRSNGAVGIRNYIGVLTSVNCSATVARLICEAAQKSGMLDAYPNIDGVVPITHTSGCGMAGSGEGFDILRRTLWGTAANPNFGGIILVGLGCEVIQVARLAKDYELAGGDHFKVFTIQDVGGTRKAVAEGLAQIEAMLPMVGSARRTETAGIGTAPRFAVWRVRRLVRLNLQSRTRRRRRPAGGPRRYGDPVGNARDLWR